MYHVCNKQARFEGLKWKKISWEGSVSASLSNYVYKTLCRRLSGTASLHYITMQPSSTIIIQFSITHHNEETATDHGGDYFSLPQFVVVGPNQRLHYMANRHFLHPLRCLRSRLLRRSRIYTLFTKTYTVLSLLVVIYYFVVNSWCWIAADSIG